MFWKVVGPIQLRTTRFCKDPRPRNVYRGPLDIADLYWVVAETRVHLPTKAGWLAGSDQRDGGDGELQTDDGNHKATAAKSCGHNPEKASIILIAPGPMMTMNNAGKMHTRSGKRIFTVTFCAFSSAR